MAADANPTEKKEIKKLSKKVYETELERLQIELVKLQEWIKYQKLKVLVKENFVFLNLGLVR